MKIKETDRERQRRKRSEAESEGDVSFAIVATLVDLTVVKWWHFTGGYR